jgi:hypothetical protein
MVSGWKTGIVLSPDAVPLALDKYRMFEWETLCNSKGEDNYLSLFQMQCKHSVNSAPSLFTFYLLDYNTASVHARYSVFKPCFFVDRS